MKKHLASHAGFCAGVRRAMKVAENCAENGGKWVTLGPLVHNEAVVGYLQSRGIESLDNLKALKLDTGVIIRSHGVPAQVIEQINEQNVPVCDATCPLVKRVQEIAAMLYHEGYQLIIYGDIAHPEVQGILGWCEYKATVILNAEQLTNVVLGEKVGLVAQTTRDEDLFFELARALVPRIKELRIFNTICPATRNRVKAARELCGQVEMMLVIGDLHSSNTTTLFGECINTGVKTIRVQKAEDLKPEWFRGVSSVGVTAGASTPDWIIKEVLDRMTGFEEKENQNIEAVGTEESFAKLEAEMADFATPSRGDVIKGTVVQVLDDEVMVDVGGKSEGIIPLREMSVKEANSARDLVQVGEEIEVLVLKWDDDGTILLSKKKVDSKRILDELEKVYENKESIEGTVLESVKGGLLVDVGVVAFLPASHVEDGYVRNLDEYIGQTLKFNIIEFNRNKRRGSQVVLSRRELVTEEKNRMKNEFWANIEEGQTRKGRIKRIVDYGAFIDLGGYEGLLHVSELDHRRIEHPADVLQEGDEIDVYVLGLDRDKERVSLSRKKLLKSPWELALEQYKEGDVIEGTVVRIAPFGAFVELDPGVDGLVHISQLADYRVEKPEDVVSAGERVKVKILSIDPGEKRIGLSIKEARNMEDQEAVQEYLEQQEEEDNEVQE